MKYEENVWYGWNGGECPVHPETVVEIMSEHGSDRGCAKTMGDWDHEDGVSPVVAFRVIEEHREPRKCLVNFDTMEFRYSTTENSDKKYLREGYVYACEVL